jgi:hypothetical protein
MIFPLLQSYKIKSTTGKYQIYFKDQIVSLLPSSKVKGCFKFAYTENTPHSNILFHKDLSGFPAESSHPKNLVRVTSLHMTVLWT